MQASIAIRISLCNFVVGHVRASLPVLEFKMGQLAARTFFPSVPAGPGIHDGPARSKHFVFPC